MNIHPYVRGFTLFFALAGTIFARDVLSMLIFWLFVIVPLLIWINNIYQHINFLKIVITPILIILLFVYGIVLKAPPDKAIGSDPIGGSLYAIFIVLRLILIAGIFQAFLSIEQSKLIYTLKYWGLKGDILYVVVGAFSIWADVVNKADKIVTARYARGLIPNRKFISRIRQVPFVIKPLLTGLLRLAIDRSESWKQRDSLLHMSNFPLSQDNTRKIENVIMILLTLSWLIFNLNLYINK